MRVLKHIEFVFLARSKEFQASVGATFSVGAHVWLFVGVVCTATSIGNITWEFSAGRIVVKNWGSGVVHGVDVFNGGPVLEIETGIVPDSRQVFSKSFVAFALGNFASIVSSSWVTVNNSAGNRVVVFALVWVAIFTVLVHTFDFNAFFASVQASAGSVDVINWSANTAGFSGVVWEAVASVVSDHFG